MATFTRKNAWNQNGTFHNPDLLWYAKGVSVMQSRSLNDQTSWWFFAAIHGNRWPNIPGPPLVPTTPQPSQGLIDQYWAQCQHGTWFFPPWHRGYLYAIENILREIIQSLGGPGDWTLPYWNYFGPDNQYKIPPAFTVQNLPDGDLNPLLVAARYGPNNDGNIFVPLSSWGITQECQKDYDFVGGNSNGNSGDYGGAETGFEHFASLFGDLEWNPHNFVHAAVGGQTPTGRGGLMSNPETAGLDPIFYLHHCNIDRMWAAWNSSGKANPNDPNWLSGPTASGDRKFYMPKPDRTPWQYAPDVVNDTGQLNYTYDNLSLGIPPELAGRDALRLRNFGLTMDETRLLSTMNLNANTELVGANSSMTTLDATGARTTVKLDSKGWETVTKSLTNTFAARINNSPAATNLPDQVYLQLEGVKGNEDSIVCSVSINQQYVGHISLFGLYNASIKDSQHGGAGLTIRLDITKIVDQMHLSGMAELNSLDVLIQPVNIVAEGSELTIDRVSVYRKGLM
ncbi:tyrosinase family protein [Dyadobacter sp. CY326]|uniref:tyrosinase family protein n=1 Tax=Dyadobacter sp. CY326 TaxID=2907300 RepID=UPI001F307500|nr:tyrosinase family protein [Dyadobacter sp. CY326]MCE7066667.1 tyrosinase family protein [Dyadobacter sp. CY326]